MHPVQEHVNTHVCELLSVPNNRVIKQRPRKVYLYHKADTNALLSDLRRWSDEFSSRDLTDTSVNDMYVEFQNSLETAMDTHIPSKIVSKRNQTPWINKRVKRLHKRKQRAFWAR